MEKWLGTPRWLCSRRRIRAQAEWKVRIHMPVAIRVPSSPSTRSAISWAALLVKVMARISYGLTPFSLIRYAIRWVSARVLPLPAPATIRTGPSVCRTASRWMSLRGSSRGDIGEDMRAQCRSPNGRDVRPMLDRVAHGTVLAVSALVTDVPARHRLDWRTPVRWFGLLCLMGAAFFAGYVAWLLWGTGLQTQRAQDALRPAIEGQIANPRPPSEGPRPGSPVIPGSAYGVIMIRSEERRGG